MSMPLPLLAWFVVAWMPAAHAGDLGVVGPTYEIAEPDLLEVIESRLKRMQQTGELARTDGGHDFGDGRLLRGYGKWRKDQGDCSQCGTYTH